MKNKLVISLSAIVITSGVTMSFFSFFNRTPVAKPTSNLVVESETAPVVVDETNIIDTTPLTETPAPVTEVVIEQPVVVAPQPVVLTIEEKLKMISDRFSTNGKMSVYIFISSNLIHNYPEKFTAETIQATMDYIDTYFADFYKGASTFTYYRAKFTW